jgi:membrane-associated phospholipid phosphatase
MIAACPSATNLCGRGKVRANFTQNALPVWSSRTRVSGLTIMDSLIVAVAQYLIFVILVATGIIWLFLPRHDKVGLAVQGIVSLVITVVLIQLAATIHSDPRPFVVDPSIKPLFAHPADNGFPSDHTALAFTLALPVMSYRRMLGTVLLVASFLVGVARVAAHVHHGQDIVAGVLIAVVAVGIATGVWRWARPRLPPRLAELASP